MTGVLTRNWRLLAVRGVVAILFGLFLFARPGLGILTLLMMFGIYAFLDGVFTAGWAIVTRRDESHWVTLLLVGLAGIAAGILTFTRPGLTAAALLVIIAVWAIVVGILKVATAIRLRKTITGEWLLILAGILGVVFGAVLLSSPVAGALAVVTWIGVYAVISGIVLLVLSFRLRNWGKTLATGAAPAH